MTTFDIRLPDLSGETPEQQMRNIQNYLYQLQSQLQFALGSIDAKQEVVEQAATNATRQIEKQAAANAPTSVFNNVKALIIKSADIVNAYYEQISMKLSGEYVASGDFGEFRETTENSIDASSDRIDQIYKDVQQLSGTLDGISDQLIQVNAYIRTGLLNYDDEGAPVYGVEIGQQNTIDGAQEFKKYARMTAGKLAFYDQNDTEVAYISDYKLHITQAEITELKAENAEVNELAIGDYVFSVRNGHLRLT